MIRVLSSVVGFSPDYKSWTSDPAEGGMWLDWGCHGADALRWAVILRVVLLTPPASLDHLHTRGTETWCCWRWADVAGSADLAIRSWL